IAPELLNELHVRAERAAQGVCDRDDMRKALERMDRMRQGMPETDMAVALVREARDQERDTSLPCRRHATCAYNDRTDNAPPDARPWANCRGGVMTLAYPFSKVEGALHAMAVGRVVIVVADEQRENEGDFVAAAERVTPEIVEFMIAHGRGQFCMPIMPELA